MLLYGLRDDTKNATLEQRICDGLPRYEQRFGVKANLVEVHTSVDLSQISIAKVTVRHALAVIISDEHTFYMGHEPQAAA